MSNETLTVIKPFIVVGVVAIFFLLLMRAEYRKAVKSILTAVLIWLGIKND